MCSPLCTPVGMEKKVQDLDFFCNHPWRWLFKLICSSSLLHLQSRWGTPPARSPSLQPPPPPRPPAPRRSWPTPRAAITAPPPQRRSPATPATCPLTAQLTRTPMPTRSRALPYLRSQPPVIQRTSRLPCPALPFWLRPVSTHTKHMHLTSLPTVNSSWWSFNHPFNPSLV